MEKSSPTPVYAFFALVIAMIVFMSSSRTAMLLLMGYFTVAGIFLLTWRLRHGRGVAHPALSGMILAGALVIVAGAAWYLNLDKSIEQIRNAVSESGQEIHLTPRSLARQATLDLIAENRATGWGAGSFRHVFPIAQRNYEGIYRASWNPKIIYGWHHAHNDYLELLAELGIIGCLLILPAPLWLFFKSLKLGISNPVYLVFFLGMLLPFAHAWIDFPFYNCAILTTICALWILLLKWMELETTR
jgi:O-antigen ligase